MRRIYEPHFDNKRLIIVSHLKKVYKKKIAIGCGLLAFNYKLVPWNVAIQIASRTSLAPVGISDFTTKIELAIQKPAAL